MLKHNDVGKMGEDIAALYLQEKGYIIYERDWRSTHRDIDIVAVDGDTMVFVEVKTLTDSVFRAPEEAVDKKKIINLRKAINHYVKSHQIDRPLRFDIISIVGPETNPPVIEHFENVSLFTGWSRR